MAAGRKKMCRCSSLRPGDGFTLVELLLAIFIFAIVVSSVYGSYRVTFNVIHGSESRLKMANGARVVLERLNEDLSSVIKGPEGSLHGKRTDFSGKRGDSLSFISESHLILHQTDSSGGPALVEYHIEKDDNTGLLNLYRSEQLLLPGVEINEEEAKKYLICRDLQELRLRYFDQDGNESDEWQSDNGISPGEEAETDPSLPSLVAIELTFAEAGDSDTGTLFKTAVALL